MRRMSHRSPGSDDGRVWRDRRDIGPPAFGCGFDWILSSFEVRLSFLEVPLTSLEFPDQNINAVGGVGVLVPAVCVVHEEGVEVPVVEGGGNGLKIAVIRAIDDGRSRMEKWPVAVDGEGIPLAAASPVAADTIHGVPTSTGAEARVAQVKVVLFKDLKIFRHGGNVTFRKENGPGEEDVADRVEGTAATGVSVDDFYDLRCVARLGLAPDLFRPPLIDR